MAVIPGGTQRRHTSSSRHSNAAPADLLDFGLPDGFVDRLESRDYGDALTVHFASRFDQREQLLAALAYLGVDDASLDA